MTWNTSYHPFIHFCLQKDTHTNHHRTKMSFISVCCCNGLVAPLSSPINLQAPLQPLTLKRTTVIASASKSGGGLSLNSVCTMSWYYDIPCYFGAYGWFSCFNAIILLCRYSKVVRIVKAKVLFNVQDARC